MRRLNIRMDGQIAVLAVAEKVRSKRRVNILASANRLFVNRLSTSIKSWVRGYSDSREGGWC
jgi:hypothetical protein